ncbi:MAG: EAL domain-containing protein [Pseudomonadota bacterium]
MTTLLAFPVPDGTADIESETQRRKTALLYRNAGVAQLVTVVSAALLGFVNVTLHAPPLPVWIWLGCMIAISASRYQLARRFRKAQPDANASGHWRQRYILATALAAVAWGAGTVLFIWGAPVGARLFTGLVMAGMVAGAIPILSAVPAAFRIFTLPILVPMALAILLQAETALDWAFGSMTLLLLAAVLASARYLHDTLDLALRLGLEQGRLADNLARARDEAEAALAERRQAEATLHASEERHRLILQHSPTGILQYGADLVITYCNERLAHILQADRERLVGLDMRTLKDQRVLPALQAALTGEEGRYIGEYISTLSPHQLWIAMTCAPLRNTLGEIDGGIAIVEDISEQQRSEAEIRHLAFYDPLTHLPNRRLLMDRLGQALVASRRSQAYGTLMILDLDHFKRINDTQGHDIGDRLLVEVALRIAACLRREDTVSRLGGDEYVVMLEGLGPSEVAAAAEAEHIAEKIRLTLGQPYMLGGSESEYYSTTSIGLTLFSGRDDSPESLLKQADVALYQAKDAGRNAIRFFSPAMQAAIDTRASLEAALRRGLDKGEFLLHYQPQVDQSGRLIGAEALLRWQPSGQAVVSPAQFIPLAEESGLIVAIGQWVLHTACAQLKDWANDPRTHGLQLAVNVSARQFHQPDFVAQVRRSLLASGADPTRLKLELTENVVLDNIESVVERMHELDQLGIGFSLDDFGTGYSSLSYLKRLPLDMIKIDQSFVRDVPDDPNDAAIVRAILAMSRSLGLQAIAEGVETEAQRDFLMENGCTAFQGYLFGRPMPIGDWTNLLGQSGPVGPA